MTRAHLRLSRDLLDGFLVGDGDDAEVLGALGDELVEDVGACTFT